MASGVEFISESIYGLEGVLAGFFLVISTFFIGLWNPVVSIFLDWEDYPNIYSLADLFIMPAESELQSIVTMEAIASGLPVVVVNKGAVPELASNGNGLLFEPGDSKILASHIVEILSDKKLKKSMGTKSLKLIKRHSMSTIGSQYEQVYNNVLDTYKE